MPKVSVIVPVFNVEEFLPKCLDSLINQTLKDIEIICVDDGSTDKSLQILQNYANKDNRIKILNQQNKGAGLARTSAMKVAQGEYIGFVDSDDWVDLNFYETLYNKAKDADIVRTCYKEVCGKKVKENRFNKIINKKVKNNLNLDKNEHSIVIWNAIYRTEFLRKNNIDYFDESLPMCHDVAFTARVDLLSQKTMPANGTFYYYRKNRPGQLITPSIKRIKCSLKANEIVTEFVNTLNLNEKDYKQAYGRCIWRLDSTFKKYLKFKEFDKDLQEEYFQTFSKILKNYKFNDDKKLKKKGLDLILNENYKKYIKKRTYKLFGYENNQVHRKITIFGLKLKIKAQNAAPPLINWNYS